MEEIRENDRQGSQIESGLEVGVFPENHRRGDDALDRFEIGGEIELVDGLIETADVLHFVRARFRQGGHPEVDNGPPSSERKNRAAAQSASREPAVSKGSGPIGRC